MVEINTKYKIGTRRFGYINWIGTYTLYKKEVLRFLIVWIQTIFSPLVSSLLFLMVLSLALGSTREDVLGVPFITFLAPGLIAMQVIQQSFSHSSSSFMISKIQGNIVDILYAPLSAIEVTLAISLAAVTRSVMIAVISIFVFYLIIDFEIQNYLMLIIFTFLASFILGNIGIIAGLWAEKFDHMATVTNFVIICIATLINIFASKNTTLLNNGVSGLTTFGLISVIITGAWKKIQEMRNKNTSSEMGGVSVKNILFEFKPIFLA